MSEQLSRQQVAERVGVKPGTLDTYRKREVMPEPTGYVGASPWWDSDVIDEWNAARRKHTREAATA